MAGLKQLTCACIVALIAISTGCAGNSDHSFNGPTAWDGAYEGFWEPSAFTTETGNTITLTILPDARIEGTLAGAGLANVTLAGKTDQYGNINLIGTPAGGGPLVYITAKVAVGGQLTITDTTTDTTILTAQSSLAGDGTYRTATAASVPLHFEMGKY